MQKIEGEGYQEMSTQDFEKLTARLEKNKLEFFRILEENPKVGVYANETKEDWDRFYTFYINFLKSEIGPRGDCAKRIRAELMQRQDEINKVLLPFKQNASTHIRQIFMKHKFFVPCKEYSQLLKIEEVNSKFVSNLERLRDPSSPMVKSILEGLRAKHGEEYDFQPQFKRLQQNYITKIEQAEKEMVVLKEIVNKTQAYHQYMRVKHVFQPYFKAWVEADSFVGKESVKTGSLFQQKVAKDMIPYLIYRQKSNKAWKYSDKKFQIFINTSWIPKNLGQIDIAFGYKDEVEDRYFIFTLIECKSRLFDLREAYKQVSLDDQESVDKGPTLAELKEMKKLKQMSRNKTMKDRLQQKEGPKPEPSQPSPEQQPKKEQPKPLFNITKKFLSTKYGPAELVSDHHFYIISTLPQNDFVLPIESKMKQGIEKHTKNLFTEDIQSEPLYQSLLQKFSTVKSPLQWIRLHEQKMKGQGSNILILN